MMTRRCTAIPSQDSEYPEVVLPGGPAGGLPWQAVALSFATLSSVTLLFVTLLFVTLLFSTLLFSINLATAADRSPIIAGLSPQNRPVGAPRIIGFVPPEGWHAQALRGIEGTPPPLRFLADQGAWYTPFDRPGMPGPYDLRGWHRPSEERR